MRFGLWDLGFGIQGIEFQVFGCRVEGWALNGCGFRVRRSNNLKSALNQFYELRV